MEIRNKYSERKKSSITFDINVEKSRSRTKQSFAKEANINNIMKKYSKTGILVDPSAINTGRFAVYGDFSNGVEFLEVQNRIASANQNFERLPSNIRAMFDNSPAQLLDFMANPDNLEECIELGLVKKPDNTPYDTKTGEPLPKPAEPVTPPAEPAEGV